MSVSHDLGLTIWLISWGSWFYNLSVRDTGGRFDRNRENSGFWVWNGFLCPTVEITASWRHCLHIWLVILHLVHWPALPRCCWVSGLISLLAAFQSVCSTFPWLFPLVAWLLFSAYSLFSSGVYFFQVLFQAGFGLFSLKVIILFLSPHPHPFSRRLSWVFSRPSCSLNDLSALVQRRTASTNSESKSSFLCAHLR